MRVDWCIDVIIGAPFEDEDHGAAYIYHGCATGLIDHYAQKLSPASLQLPALQGFGHSFASFMDIDNNSYPGNNNNNAFIFDIVDRPQLL